MNKEFTLSIELTVEAAEVFKSWTNDDTTLGLSVQEKAVMSYLARHRDEELRVLHVENGKITYATTLEDKEERKQVSIICTVIRPISNMRYMHRMTVNKLMYSDETEWHVRS